MLIHTFLAQEPIKYDGSQLSSTWAYRRFGLKGPSLVSFCGECHVDLTHMVDIEDVLAGDYIYSPNMLHFIAEHFDLDLEKTVMRQRLLITIVAEQLRMHGVTDITRDGDDLYCGKRKLSVSIATLTRVSTMIHLGLNLTSKGTPVPTISLPELGVNDTEGFARQVIEAYCEELNSIFLARCKVRGVD